MDGVKDSNVHLKLQRYIVRPKEIKSNPPKETTTEKPQRLRAKLVLFHLN